MKSSEALKAGIVRVNRAPVILVSVYAVTVLTVLPMSIIMRNAIETHLGGSLTAEQVARGVHYQWWSEFAAQAGQLGEAFSTAIVGFAAVLDNLSTLLDREARPIPILWLGACYVLLWLFLSGGILDRYARARPTRTYEFFSACGVYFVRFLRLAPLIGLTYLTLFMVVHPFLFGNVYEAVTRDVTAERTAFLWRAALYLVFGVLLLIVNVIFDFAKVRAVVEDRRSMIGALAAGLRFVRRNGGAVASLYLMNGVMFIALLVLYALVAPGAESTGVAMWLGFLVSQVYLLGRLWVRLVFFASETALFQGRLAHAGYVASAPVARAEPPITEPFIVQRP